MLLRDRDAGTAHHRYGGSRWDAWASHLGEAPAPYTQAATTAAIRFYATLIFRSTVIWGESSLSRAAALPFLDEPMTIPALHLERTLPSAWR